MQWTVRPYTPADEAEWDRFVMHESGNGTFLQTRNFLNYHPAGRFTDASLMVYNEHGGLGAVVPAALRLDGATRIFRSHPGSTFGGPVLRSTYNSAAKSIGILQAVEDYIATRYDAADFRPTPDLFNGVENVAQMGGSSVIDQKGMTVKQAVDAIRAVGGRAFVVLQNVNRTTWADYIALEMK